MPVFTAKASNLQAIGPILDIQIRPARAAIDAILRSGGTPPPPIVVSAMIDTGATCSVIKTGVPAQLGLNAVGAIPVSTPTSHNVVCSRYLISLVFPSTGGLKMPVAFDLVMTETPLPGQNIQCLLGRDFLAHGVFFYSGPDSTFTFSF